MSRSGTGIAERRAELNFYDAYGTGLWGAGALFNLHIIRAAAWIPFNGALMPF